MVAQDQVPRQLVQKELLKFEKQDKIAREKLEDLRKKHTNTGFLNLCRFAIHNCAIHSNPSLEMTEDYINRTPKILCLYLEMIHTMREDISELILREKPQNEKETIITGTPTTDIREDDA